jgi:hypothetical protein
MGKSLCFLDATCGVETRVKVFQVCSRRLDVAGNLCFGDFTHRVCDCAVVRKHFVHRWKC